MVDMDALRATSKLTIARVINAIIYFSGIAYFSQKLGPKEMGVYFLFHSLVAVLTIPADFGIRAAVQQRLSAEESPSTALTTAIVLKLVPLGIVALGIFIFERIINSYIGADLALFLIVALALEEYSTFTLSVIKGELSVGKTAIVRVVDPIVWFVVGITSINAGFEAKGIVFAMMAGNAAMLLVGTLRATTPLGRPSISSLHSIWDFSKYRVISSVGTFAHNWLDVLILGFFLGQAAVGIYEIAWRVSNSLLLFARSLAETVIPQVSNWDAYGDQSEIESFIPVAILLSLIVVLPGIVGVSILSEEILSLVFGEDFGAGSLVLIILVSGKAFEAVHGIFGRVLAGLDRPDVAARISVVMVLLNVLLNIALVSTIGIAGAAIATVVSFSVGTIGLWYLLHSHINLKIPVKGIAFMGGTSVGMGLLVLLMNGVAVVDSLPKLFGVVGFGVLAYSLLVYANAPLRETLLSGLRQIS